ncbi:MAG: hypothetical protein Q8835_02870, partial [Sweet potato little leaf phytoplasma]|nr:hypothetical protein [Sweet potato little leaf phytoplasma]
SLAKTGSTATCNTGSGKLIFSKTIKSFPYVNVSPVMVFFKPILLLPFRFRSNNFCMLSLKFLYNLFYDFCQCYGIFG